MSCILPVFKHRMKIGTLLKIICVGTHLIHFPSGCMTVLISCLF